MTISIKENFVSSLSQVENELTMMMTWLARKLGSQLTTRMLNKVEVSYLLIVNGSASRSENIKFTTADIPTISELRTSYFRK